MNYSQTIKTTKAMQNPIDTTGATVVAPSDFHDTKSETLYNQQVRHNFLRKRAQARAHAKKNNTRQL